MRRICAIFIRNIIALPLFLWQFLFFLLPLFLLTYQGNIGIKKIIHVVKWLYANNFIKIVFFSFSSSIVISFFCVTFGYLFCYIISQKKSFLKTILILFTCIPFLSNFIIHIASWISFLDPNGYIYNFLISIGFIKTGETLLYNYSSSIIVLIYCYMPYAILPLYNPLSKIDYNLAIAAQDLGATKLKTFFSIIIPSTKSAIYTSFFLVFIPASSEFIIYDFIAGGKFLSCGSLFTYVTLAPSLIEIAPILTLFYIISLIFFSFILLFILKKIFFLCER